MKVFDKAICFPPSVLDGLPKNKRHQKAGKAIIKSWGFLYCTPLQSLRIQLFRELPVSKQHLKFGLHNSVLLIPKFSSALQKGVKNQTNKNPENFKHICKNSDSNTASSPRSALRATAAAQSKLCKVLPVAVAVLCLTESKEQAENYRQGEVPGWYYTNPC